jgi:hypothetical protein
MTAPAALTPVLHAWQEAGWGKESKRRLRGKRTCGRSRDCTSDRKNERICKKIVTDKQISQLEVAVRRLAESVNFTLEF